MRTFYRNGNMTELEQACGVCDKEFGELPEERFKVTCNGPCGRTFHALCADVKLTLLEAITANDGVLWFCQSCRLSIDKCALHRGSAPKRCCGQIAAESDIRGEPTAKKPKSSADNEVVLVRSSLIPVEIWAKVFGKLNFINLCRVRFVNKQWKTIVDRFSMDKFVLNPSKVVSGNQHFEMPPASTIRIGGDISVVGSWWSPSITEKLVNLDFIICNMLLLKGLLTMLSHTPNLVSLCLQARVRSASIIDESDSEFSKLQLTRMKNLTLDLKLQGEILEKFIQMFPKLENFALLSNDHENHHRVLRMIKTLPNLQGISLVLSSNQFSHLVEVNRQLKQFSIAITTVSDNENFNKNLISFSKNQPLLECFDFALPHIFFDDLSCEVLTKVFKNLRNLKRLSMKLAFRTGDISIGMQSIGCLTELECFTLRLRHRFGPRSSTSLLFAGVKSSKLKELFLDGVKINASELREYIVNAPNLSMITLQSCSFVSWSALFTALQSKVLRRLELVYVHVSNSDDICIHESLDGLRYLELFGCMMKKRVLSTLLSMCPRLEELHLIGNNNVCDDIVLMFCQRMKQLRRLTLECCSITDAAFTHMKKYALNLEHLEFKNCKNITGIGITQLHGTNIAIIDVNPLTNFTKSLTWCDPLIA